MGSGPRTEVDAQRAGAEPPGPAPPLRTENKTKNLVAQGAYVAGRSRGQAAGDPARHRESEVAIANGPARDLLQAEGDRTRVVSMPCWEIFEEQPETYRKRVLPGGPVRVAVEAAIASAGTAGSTASGAGARSRASSACTASAPRPRRATLYTHFGITAEAVAEKVKSLL